MSSRRLSLRDYKVAWICALPIELAAAKSLLNDVHKSPPQPTDRNAYTLGSMYGHNIAIACLQSGVYGTTSAASVATQMKQTFPSIEFGLIVGVGGGVPTGRADIRLGDVVVSTPVGQLGGVVQYDYGKSCQYGSFERIGSLNKPYLPLLVAVSQLRCGYILQDTQMGKIMSDVLEHHKDAFSRPDEDWLFEPTYGHHGGGGDCSSCDKNHLVLRGSRASNEPHIHYGLIASDDRVIRDAQTRDTYAENLPILCFEMESAGVMDQLPCLVIRGICDYCDSHKQKDWQGYAALAAAAYAKELLSIVPLAKDVTVYEQGSGLTEKEKEFLGNLSIADPQGAMNSFKRVKGNRTPGTCSWFLESDELKSWFRRDKGLAKKKSNVMWLYGNPGTGKSTMSIALVEELPKKDYFSTGNNVLSSFFCDASLDCQRTVTSILRGLLYQIFSQRPELIGRIMPKYEIQKERLFTTFDALWALLMDIGRVTCGPEIYCIVDALDECEPHEQEILLRQIDQSFNGSFSQGSVPPRVHFFIASRPYPEIRSYLSLFTCIDLGSRQEILADLKATIHEKVKALAMRKCYSTTVKERVIQALEEKADGTFLWVGIVCDRLNQPRTTNPLKTLQNLPQGLHSLYRNLLDDAFTAENDEEDYQTMKEILRLVAFARRPMTMAELADACELYPDENNDSRLQFTRAIVDLCRLLVIVDKGYVRLLHTSVQDFLVTQMSEMKALTANYALSCRCINTILENNRMKTQHAGLAPEQAFLGYAVVYWPKHAGLAETEFVIRKEHREFFENRYGAWECWLETYNHLTRGTGHDLRNGHGLVHVAARWGIFPVFPFLSQEKLEDKDPCGRTPLLVAAGNAQVKTLRFLVESGANVKALDDEHQNILHILCNNGHYNDNTMAKFLLDKGLSLYDCDKDNMTPFLYAVANLDERFAQLFLRYGFDLNTKIQRRWWPGRTTVGIIAPRRSNAKKEVAAPNLESGLTALHFSALNACTKMTGFLLRYGAHPNVRSEAGDTPLHLAIRCGLLGRECHDAWGKGTYAIESLRELIMDPASEEASDIDRAIDQARAHVVDKLLESEVIDVNVANTCGEYPQHLINFRKDYALSILCKLTEKGADIARMNGSHQTCLHLASKVGNLEVVRRLVEEGQNIVLEDIDGLSPFHYALHEGRLDVLQYMAKACARALSEVWNTPDRHGRTPLHHHVSSVFCAIDVVDFLIQAGCDVHQPDEERNSSLGLYVGSFHLGVERMIFSHLVQKGADPLWVNARRQNLLHLLMRHRGADNEILEYLFNIGIDPTARDVDGKTFMHYGAIHGAFTEELIDFLRCRGVLDLHTRDSIGKSPLDYAEAKARQQFPDDILLHLDQKWEKSFNILTAVARTLL
ncbi:ankyrin [Aspergillus unguis]